MDFTNFAYERPDLQTVQAELKTLVEQFRQAETAQTQIELMAQVNSLRAEADSMYNICFVRYSINTADPFYEAETKFFDEHYPAMNEVVTDYYRALLASPFRAELEAHWGKQIFVLAELSLKTFEPEILKDMQEENRLDSEYRKIKAQAKLEFRGQTYNLSSIGLLEQDSERETRRQASEVKWAYYAQQAEKIEGIYEQLVQTRTRMAKTLGYSHYTPLGYARMRRSDYTPEMVATFRQAIVEHIVPLCQEIYARQAKRLGLDKLHYYDEGFRFVSGNPKPKGGVSWQEERAGRMYRELSPETAAFFEEMQGRQLMDLASRDNKEPGGYCTFIPKYQAPFIFANFNGTSHDVVVLTHEAGHAFQCYETAKQTALYEYLWPTYEACEIHSMSMEFLTWPWMQLFFEEDIEKFKFAHLEGALRFLPYGCAVDEFQHEVYAQPDMSPAERNATWRRIEQKYLPQRDYQGNSFLEQGGFWQCQQHIFGSPFYYIDYVLAQICALQFWKRHREGDPNTWADYMALCRAGGSLSFLDLLKIAKLRSPFEPGTLQDMVAEIKTYLNSVDDSQF